MLHPLAHYRLAILISLSTAALACNAAEPLCPPTGWSRAALLELREREFQLDGTSVADAAIELLPCLYSADPILRDQIAFTAIATWGRSKQLPSTTALKLLVTLQQKLGRDAPDATGFAKPFAALTLAEVARMDRLDPFMSDKQREELLGAATAYMRSITDYRGFDDAEGWRHGVAHAADLLVQLSLNPELGKPQLDEILSALATQIAPRSTHFYIYGEPARLAAPIYWIAGRNLHTTAEWEAWLRTISDPAPLATWSESFDSQVGLAKRHNTMAFLQALFSYAHRGDSAAVKTQLLPAIEKALQLVP